MSTQQCQHHNVESADNTVETLEDIEESLWEEISKSDPKRARIVFTTCQNMCLPLPDEPMSTFTFRDNGIFCAHNVLKFTCEECNRGKIESEFKPAIEVKPVASQAVLAPPKSKLDLKARRKLKHPFTSAKKRAANARKVKTANQHV